jgi:nucleoside-diphosphate-sugar epimerase
MRILIIGALGHIGSRLIRSFPEIFPELEIDLLDNLRTQRFCSLFDLPKGTRYRFHEQDFVTCELSPLVEGADAVIHLGAIVDATRSHEIAEEVFLVNHKGTLRVGEACAQAGTPLIFASTTSIYGPQKDTVDESCSEEEIQPQSPYAQLKLEAERGLSELAASCGLRHTALRFGTVFGPSPGIRFHTAVNKFTWQAVTGSPITVWRTALHQCRPYLSLDDLTRALAFLIQGRHFSGELYNVVSLNATVRDLLDVIEERTGEVTIDLVEHQVMNQLSYTVSNEKLQRLGFEFQGDLRSGMHATIDLIEQCHSRA